MALKELNDKIKALIRLAPPSYDESLLDPRPLRLRSISRGQQFPRLLSHSMASEAVVPLGCRLRASRRRFYGVRPEPCICSRACFT
eukprot:8681230-Prorocentrum_lima.AAC.1